MILEPAWVGIATTIMLALLGGGLYVIRAEVRKGNDVGESAHEELIPNHGSSLRDAIDRIESRMHEDRVMYLARIDDVHDDVKAMRSRVDLHIDHHDKRM